MEIAVHLDMKEFLNFMGAMPRKLENALNRGLQAAAFIVEGQAKIKTPVDTGRLRASIYTMAGHLQATVSTNVNYARFVHEGTRFMRAQPFMAEGARASEYNITRVFNDEINKALT